MDKNKEKNSFRNIEAETSGTIMPFSTRSKSIQLINPAKQLRLMNLDNNINNSFLNIQKSINRRANHHNNNNSKFDQNKISPRIRNENVSTYGTLYKQGNTTKFQDEKPIKFEEFKEKIAKVIEPYKIETYGLPKEVRIGKFNYITENERISIGKQLNPISKPNKTYYNQFNAYNEANTLVTVDHDEYANPYDSLNTVRKNNNICNDVINIYDSREKQLLLKTLNELNTSIYLKDQLHKIKITNLIPKQNEEIEDVPIKKEVHISSIMPSPCKELNELYCYFNYAKNQFPESREQFTLSYDFFYVILFGGIVSNKSNTVWSLDPGKFCFKLN